MKRKVKGPTVAPLHLQLWSIHKHILLFGRGVAPELKASTSTCLSLRRYLACNASVQWKRLPAVCTNHYVLLNASPFIFLVLRAIEGAVGVLVFNR